MAKYDRPLSRAAHHKALLGVWGFAARATFARAGDAAAVVNAQRLLGALAYSGADRPRVDRAVSEKRAGHGQA